MPEESEPKPMEELNIVPIRPARFRFRTTYTDPAGNKAIFDDPLLSAIGLQKGHIEVRNNVDQVMCTLKGHRHESNKLLGITSWPSMNPIDIVFGQYTISAPVGSIPNLCKNNDRVIN